MRTFFGTNSYYHRNKDFPPLLWQRLLRTLKHHLPVLEEHDDDEYESEGGDYVIPTSVLGNDNMGTTQTVNNPETKPRNRFVGTKHFKTRKYIMWARLAVNYIPTAKNVSDISLIKFVLLCSEKKKFLKKL